MTRILRSAAAAPAPLPIASAAAIAAAIAQAARHLLPHLERGRASTPPSCAPRWRPPSAPPMRPAPGTGRPPTTPARRRPSCSCANTARPCSRKAGVSGRHAADAGEDRRPSSHPHAPLRGERGAPAVLDADPAWPRGAAPPPRSRRPIVVLEPSAGTGLLAILAETRRRLARSQRARRDPRRTSARHLFPGRRRHPLRRRADRRSSRCRRSRRASC